MLQKMLIAFIIYYLSSKQKVKKMAEERQRESTRIRELKEKQAEKDRLRSFHSNQQLQALHRHHHSHTAPQFNTNHLPYLQQRSSKQQKSTHYLNKSNWTQKQRIRYLVFLKFYSEITFFGSDLKSIPTFKCMSTFVKTRSPQQSKSYHLSNKRLFNNQQQLIEALEEDLKYEEGYQSRLAKYQKQIMQFDEQHNFLSDHFLQMNEYFLNKQNKMKGNNNSENQILVESQQKGGKKSYNSKINISDLMKDKSNSQMQQKQKFNNGSSQLKQQEASQEAQVNSYHSNDALMNKPVDFSRTKYDINNNYNYRYPPVPSISQMPQMQQNSYFNPYAPMNKMQMQHASQMNMFQMEQMARAQRMVQQQMRNSYQEGRKTIPETSKLPVNPNIQSNMFQPNRNSSYSPYLDNRFIENRNQSNRSFPINMSMYQNISIPPIAASTSDKNPKTMPNLQQFSKYSNLDVNQKRQSPEKQKQKQKSKHGSFIDNSSQEKRKTQAYLTTQPNMSDQRKKLVEKCHQHWTKWLKAVLQLKSRKQKGQIQTQQMPVNIHLSD